MSVHIPPVATVAPPSWDADVVDSAWASSVRRRLLLALVAQAGQSSNMLKKRVGMPLKRQLTQGRREAKAQREWRFIAFFSLSAVTL